MITTIQRSSRVTAMASAALIEQDTFGIEIYFGSNSMLSPRVVLEKDIFSGQLKLKKVIINHRHTVVYSTYNVRQLKDDEINLVVAAMAALNMDCLPVGRDFITLEAAPEVVVVERTVYVDRPQTVIRETVIRERTVVVERPTRPVRPSRPTLEVPREQTSNEAAAAALGGLIGFGLGLLVNRK